MATQVTLNSGSVDSAGSLALKTNGTTTAVTINSSQGVEFNAGTAALPAICTTGDTNTGIFFPAADTIAFSEGGAEAMRIDSNGSLLVGTTARNTIVTSATKFVASSSGQDYSALFENTNATVGYGLLIKYTAVSQNNTGGPLIYAEDSTAQRFSVRSNGGVYNYTANNSPLSDRRLKKDITPAGSYLEKICAIPVVTYFYNDQSDNLLNLGVIAQDVQSAAPELCNAEGWGTKAEDGSNYLGIWETDIQYALMKCIQEQQALIQSLTTRLTTLESK